MSFEAYLGCSGQTATLHLSGDLTENRVGALRALLGQAAARAARRVVLRVQDLRSLTASAVRALAVARQELPPGADLVIVGACEEVALMLRRGGLDAVTLADAVPDGLPAAPPPALRSTTTDHFPERTLL
ncbi:STAS domain-containing protein [Streptomyces sp. NPDC047097]|uniref:STAS domain-containing protein n=1 Tax=Streptomyces sp. NPDC047097 TaxID=3155260 RepID=UPI0033FBC799